MTSLQKQPFAGVLQTDFLKILQSSQQNTCASVYFLIKLRTESLQLYQKWDSDYVKTKAPSSGLKVYFLLIFST